MNKMELIKLLDKLNLPKGEYSILSSGSLVMRGIQEQAGDLDLHVSNKGFKYIQDNFKITFKDINHEFDNPLYTMDDYDVDFFVMPDDKMFFDYVDEYPCQDVDQILAYKLQRNLPKDRISAQKILQYKKNKGTC